MIEVTGCLQIKNDKYQAVLSYYDENNKRKQKWFSTKIKSLKKNKKIALEKMEEIRVNFQENLNNQNLENLESKNILFEEYMKLWLEIEKNSVEITTYNGYKGIIYGRLSEYFTGRNITLQNITAIDIQMFYQYLLNNNLSGKTVRRYHANIRKALQYAVKTDLILSNPADKVDLPKEQEYIPTFYTSEEVKTLFKAIMGTRLEIPVMIGSLYGLRREEVIGLKWSAIDFENKTITIKHTITQSNGKLIIRDTTKTKSSRRTLPLESIAESYLLELKERQKHNMELCGNSYNQEYLEYVCVDNVGNLIRPDYVTEMFRRLLKRKKLKQIRFHDLRHSVASILLKNGANMKEIQVWLGHSNYNTTANIYAHLDSSAIKAPAKLIDNIFLVQENVSEKKAI